MPTRTVIHLYEVGVMAVEGKVEVRASLPVATWEGFVRIKGPNRLSWPQVLDLALKALEREQLRGQTQLRRQER